MNRLVRPIVAAGVVLLAQTVARANEANCDRDDVIVATSPTPRQEIAFVHRQMESKEKLQEEARLHRNANVIIGDSLAAFFPAPLLAKAGLAEPILNVAVAGDRTQHLLWELSNPAGQRIPAKNVLLIIGTNNVSAGQSACAIARGVVADVNAIEKYFAAETILVLSVLPRANKEDAGVESTINSVNDIVQAQLSASKKVTYLRVGKELDCAAPGACNLYRDNIHLTYKGYIILSDLISRASHP